jgi:uncharacterized protein (UPF0335 family)
MHDIAHDDEAIVAKLRGYVAEIRELDDASKELDRRRRDIYSEARNFGFSTDAIKRIARQRHDGEAQSEANDLLSYVEMLGRRDAMAVFRKTGSFSETVFGSTGWPSDEVDFDVPKRLNGEGRFTTVLR